MYESVQTPQPLSDKTIRKLVRGRATLELWPLGAVQRLWIRVPCDG